MESELWAKLYQQNHSVINGRGVWHYLLDTSLGQFNVVEYEQKDMSLKRFLMDASYSKAEKKFDQISIQMVKGVI